jgi:flavin-dependent dehydrogenase
MKKVDVVIIGAGPAGSVCGYLLKKAGIECLLVDHATFPRDKLCGGGLTPKCWKLLDELIPGIKYEYNSIRNLRLTVDEKHTCDFTTAIELRLVKRKEFDNQLLELYKSIGGEFVQGSFLSYEEQADGLIVTLKSGEQIACRYLVGADGSTSTVRHFLTGNHDNGFLILEQYVKKDPANRIEVDMSRKYDVRGYYYRFPNSEFDAIGYGDESATPQKFRDILKKKNIPETKLRGCHIYLKNDYPINDRVILIGDAGGFANRVTSEGIKAAFETARNAAEAIKSGRPFREVNAPMFEKMAKEERFAQFFYKPSTVWFLGVLCHIPGAVKWFFDRALRPRD